MIARLPGIAEQMGAIHKLDLTSDVTHLIVGNVSTPKYRYVAKERPDIRALGYEWVEAVRDAWRMGGTTDVEDLERKHKLGVFFGLKICVTGFDDLDERTRLSDTVAEQGAEYHGDLTKAVTHLIAAVPAGAKYTHAKNWGIPIVSAKWFHDSMTRGMALDESLFDPTLPLDQQGRGAVVNRSQARNTLGKRGREDESQGTADLGKRKLRRTASTRLHSQSQDMWQDLSSREDAFAPGATDQWKDDSEADTKQQPALQTVHVRRSDILFADNGSASDGIFAGRYILLHGFPRAVAQKLRAFLEPNGAAILQTATELEDASQQPFFKSRYLLLPHGGTTIPLPDVPAGTTIASEWWIERCIHSKRFLEPSDHALSRPLPVGDVAGFAALSINLTGFTGVELLQSARAIKLLGATYQEKLLPSASLIVSATETIKGEKAFYAAKHNIRIVSPDWLWACFAAKQVVSYDPFNIKPHVPDFRDGIREPATSSPAMSDTHHHSIDRVKKDDFVSKRLSGTRRKHATASLALKTTTSITGQPARKRAPFVLEDEESDDPTSVTSPGILAPPELARSCAQPLKERSPNASPHKGNNLSRVLQETIGDHRIVDLKLHEMLDSTVDEHDIVPPPPPGSTPPLPAQPVEDNPESGQHPPPRLREELTADLAALLHRQSTNATTSEPQKRKNRKLGRSTSSLANRSVSVSANSTPSLTRQATNPDYEAGSRTNFAHPSAAIPPGTQLGYETTDAEEHRVMMEKSMKVSLQDSTSGKRVASVGMIKDSFVGGEAGVGKRVRGRNRVK
ncbi:hypothetical protein LTR62_000094 [Meristemomyces frigidus]|uniref:BRCT domain-containing protein n=1 Tax=Meristemomyces frigidus TaxID=1508187 RepID=A0AAN7TYN8_9PEZI|nr:hypothetical protein LTR62_000094 [Meristemomyces frigidus]